MTISKKDLEKFRHIYKSLTGKELSDKEAIQKAKCILNLHIQLILPNSNKHYEDK